MLIDIFDDNGSINIDVLKLEAEKIARAKMQANAQARFNKDLDWLNDSISGYDFFNADRINQCICTLSGISAPNFATFEQRTIMDYLHHRNYDEFDDMDDNEYNQLMLLITKAIPSGVVSYDAGERLFYRTGEISPSEIAAQKKVEQEEQYKGLRGWFRRLIEKWFA